MPAMGTEQRITDPRELQWRLIYSVLVAGKNARFAEGAMDRLLLGMKPRQLPFDYLRQHAKYIGMDRVVNDARTGNYRKTAKFLREVIDSKLDLTTCSVEDLESLHGVGPKTARFFLLWTRPGVQFAALDVHVLRWLRANGYPDAPRQTPSGRLYRQLEEAFVAKAASLGKTPRQLDDEIWKAYNVGGIGRKEAA